MRTAVVGHLEWIEFGHVERVPAAGDIAHATDPWEEPAGGGAVAAVQLARLSGDCTFYTALGNDERGAWSRRELERLGVRVEAATREQPTRRGVVLLDANGERTIITLGRRLEPMSADDLPWSGLDDVDAVFVTAGDAGAVRHARRARTLVATSRIGGLLAEADVHLDAVVGSGSQAERLVFGVVPEGVVRVEASTPGSASVSADVLDVPSEIALHLNAFVLAVDPSGPVQLTGYDASGQVVAAGSAGGSARAPTPAATLEDGRHFGFVRSVDPAAGTMEFDLAYFLSGKEADQAYQEATGDTGHVPNDHFVVNDNPMLRTLTLAPDAHLRLLDWNHCCETFFDGDLSLFAQAIARHADVTDGALIYRGQSQWWITVKDGVITEIQEQYSP